MDFADKITALAAGLPRQLEHIQTEEATKNALVMPFINALGYNVFDPTEVTPELTADVGVKRGEKVDYAILRDGKPIILVEVKCRDYDLNGAHASQLYRYFAVTEARFAVLTNGIQYRFYTDLEEPNRMDSKPFFEFNMLDPKEQSVEELKKFSKSAFDMEQILATASDLKYTKEIKRILSEQIVNPSEQFVRFFASTLYPGRMTQGVRQQFTEIVKRGLQQFISDRISDRLKSALADESVTASDSAQAGGDEPSQQSADESASQGLVTTEEETEAYYVVKAILREVVDVKRVYMRDQRVFCSVLLDDTNRKPICRFWFNSNEKCLGTIGENKQETRHAIGDINDIYQYADELKQAVARYARPNGQ